MTTFKIEYDAEAETWDVLADGKYEGGFSSRADAEQAAGQAKLDDDRARAIELIEDADAATVAKVLALLGD